MAHPQSSTLRLVTPITLQRHARDAVALWRAKDAIRCLAVSRGHALGVWQEDPSRADTFRIGCKYCGAGATLDVLTADASVSELLEAPCQGVPFTLRREL